MWSSWHKLNVISFSGFEDTGSRTQLISQCVDYNIKPTILGGVSVSTKFTADLNEVTESNIPGAILNEPLENAIVS